MADPSREVYVLYLEYGPDHRQEGLSYLQKILGRVFPRAALRGRVIDTSGMSPSTPLGPLEFIRSRNDYREFSGWQTGWNSLGAVNPDAPVCICNDTFFRNYGSEYLDWFTAQEIEGALRKGQWIGYQDRFLRPVEIFGVSIDRYLRSSFMVARAQEIQEVMPLELTVPDAKIFSTDGPSLFLSEAPLSPNLKAIIDCWLCQTDPLPGEFADHWHHAEPLTPESRPRLQAKAKSILMEHWLAAKIKTANKTLFNVRTSRSRSFHWWALERIGALEVIQGGKQRALIAVRTFRHHREKRRRRAAGTGAESAVK